MNDWGKVVKTRHRKTTDPYLTFNFFASHRSFLDAIDQYIIEYTCAGHLANTLHDHYGINDHMESMNLAYGPGASILVYYVLGKELDVSADQAYTWAEKDLLFPPSTDHHRAWEAMRSWVLLSV